MLGELLKPGDLFEAPSAASLTVICRANPRRHLELWQLAICSGAGVKRVLILPHENVTNCPSAAWPGVPMT